MKVMIVDIGSNTIKYDIFESPSVYSIGHGSVAAGIIRYIEKGILQEAGMQVLVDILTRYKAIADKENIPMYTFATASLRRVTDPFRVIDEVKARTGIAIDLISGQREAQLSLSGMLAATLHENTGLMMDMGGGSTELNIFEKEASTFAVSCPFGALSLKNEFVKDTFPTEVEAQAIYTYAKSVYETYRDRIQTQTLYMVGGSAKAVAKLLYHKKGMNCDFADCTFAPEMLYDLVKEMLPLHDEDAVLLRAMFPDRYGVILPAAISYCALLAVCEAKNVRVSVAGIREGYLLEKGGLFL